MDVSVFQSLLSSSAVPWLPDAALARWAWHGAWAVVLAALVSCLACGRRRMGLMLLVALWALWPGPASPAYWLGLAFQSPSGMSVLLCLVWASRMRPRRAFVYRVRPVLSRNEVILTLGGVLLGWVLLGDMLAWWPVSVYALGFGTPALALVCVLALCLWLTGDASSAGQAASWSLLLVLLMFVLTRLPSGNLWDALLDPGLWLVLQIRVLMWLLRPKVQRW
ncbi:MAG: hypothetical protein FD135_59 [Comamonadaceae bacterium]|nr:MAG: hypothetical protein FD135_59 [Comamonadaceae bacterium]